MDCVRTARIEDYDDLSSVLAEADALHCAAVPQVFRPTHGPARSRTYIASILESTEADFLVAERDGQIVGAVQVAIRETPEIPLLVPRRYAVIGTLAVSVEHRRSGLGRLLMRGAESWARARGMSQIELSVWEFNRGAIDFYRAVGYAPSRRTLSRDLAPDDKDAR